MQARSTGRRSAGTHVEIPVSSRAEEVANAATGAAGLLASLPGLALLLDLAAGRGEASALVVTAVYGLSLVFLYLATTLYHAEPHPSTKRALRLLDHCAVYLLIAGTYTPVATLALGGRSGWTLAGAMWGLAALGVVFKVRRRFRHPGISVATYLGMGWVGVFTVRPILESAGLEAVLLLAAGGLAYTVGTIFFGLRRLRFNHAIWHLFVIAGSALHYLAIAGYVVPRVA